MQVTNDISIMLSVLMDSAERLKREAASCWLESIDPSELIVVPGVAGVSQPRFPEKAVRDRPAPHGGNLPHGKEKLDKSGYLKDIKAGIVLTGGSALMAGAKELAESVFESPFI